MGADHQSRKHVLTLCVVLFLGIAVGSSTSQDFRKHVFSMKIALTLQDFHCMCTVGLFLIMFLKYVKF